MSNRFSRWTPVALLIVPAAFVLLFPEQALAQTASATGFWGTPIQHFVDVLVGPVSLGMVLIGFVGGISGFIRCGEIDGFTRSMMVMTFSGSILLAVKPFISSLFGV